MELNDLRSAVTVVSLIVFVCIVAWAYSRRRHEAFDVAANLPLADDGSSADSKTQGSNGAKQ